MKLLNVYTPWKNGCPFRVHAKYDSLISRDIRIAYKEFTPFQCITRYPLHPCAFVGIHHKVIAPRHRQSRAESTQYRKECAILNRSCVDQIWLDFFNDAPQVKRQTW